MAPELILESGGKDHQHCDALRLMLHRTTGVVRIASPYVRENDFLLADGAREIRLLTSLDPWDIASGATSLDYLRSLMASGVECRAVADGNLHAKVYIFGNESAVVTSANLTYSGLNSNIEVGVKLRGEAVNSLARWFDALWGSDRCRSIRASDLSTLEDLSGPLRRFAAKLRKKVASKPKRRNEAVPGVRSQSDLRELLTAAPRLFVCNTNRRHSPHGEDEMLMRREKTAMAWTSFKEPSHMQMVEPGDAILMFAKRFGIIGVGRAREGCTIKEHGEPARLQNSRQYRNGEEWQVPVDDWLVWVEHPELAYRYTMRNASFVEVRGDNCADLRQGLREHFGHAE